MLESFFRFHLELIVLDEIFEESSQVVNGYVPAIGLQEESEMCNGTIRVEVKIDPHLGSFDIEVQVPGIILNIHEDIRP